MKTTSNQIQSPAETMLLWVAMFVTQINSLPSKRGERIEILAADDNTAIVVARTGIDHMDAFSRCVMHGMKQIPLPDRLRRSAAHRQGGVLPRS